MEDKNNFENEDEEFSYSKNNLGSISWVILGWASLFAIMLGYGIATVFNYIFG